MTDVVNSGYKSAAQTVSWSANPFDALINDEWTDLSDVIDNSLQRNLFMDFVLDLGSVVFTGADAAIEIYVVPSVDGTNYPEWLGGVATNEQEHNQYFAASITVHPDTAAFHGVFRKVEMPVGLFKIAVRNKANVTLNATNTLKWRPWQYSSA